MVVDRAIDSQVFVQGTPLASIVWIGIDSQTWLDARVDKIAGRYMSGMTGGDDLLSKVQAPDNLRQQVAIWRDIVGGVSEGHLLGLSSSADILSSPSLPYLHRFSIEHANAAPTRISLFDGANVQPWPIGSISTAGWSMSCIRSV
jgi:hypothetical protein